MSSQPRVLKILNVLSLLLLVVAFGMAMWYAPVERIMGAVQKVFYFHVATAWIGLLGFVAATVAGVAYLRTHNMKWDIVEVAAVEISLVFFFITIVLGSIWARSSWGTWWTWEPRLTTAAILEMTYIAYLLLRQGVEDPDRRARYSAVYTLVFSLVAPMTLLSIFLFRTIHPDLGIFRAGQSTDGGLEPRMLVTMFVSIGAFSVIFATLLWHRIRLGQLMEKVEQLKMKVMQ